MQSLEIFCVFAEPLESAGISYMITGSVACIVYGEPRMTHDIDLVIELSVRDAPKIVDAFPLEEFYCPPVEVIAIESRRRIHGHFIIIHHKTGFKADVYVKSEHALHAWALKNKRQIEIAPGRGLWFAPPEYVILRKLEFYKEGGSDKHLRDIRGIVDAEHVSLDDGFLKLWIEKLGLEDAWEKSSG